MINWKLGFFSYFPKYWVHSLNTLHYCFFKFWITHLLLPAFECSEFPFRKIWLDSRIIALADVIWSVESGYRPVAFRPAYKLGISSSSVYFVNEPISEQKHWFACADWLQLCVQSANKRSHLINDLLVQLFCTFNSPLISQLLQLTLKTNQ